MLVGELVSAQQYDSISGNHLPYHIHATLPITWNFIQILFSIYLFLSLSANTSLDDMSAVSQWPKETLCSQNVSKTVKRENVLLISLRK